MNRHTRRGSIESVLRELRSIRGQAAVELLATIPVVLVLLLAGWQIVLTGHAWWKLREAARTAARAQYVAVQRGEPAEGKERARELLAALSGSSPTGSRRVTIAGDDTVTLAVRLPLVQPFSVLGRDAGPWLRASARMAP